MNNKWKILGLLFIILLFSLLFASGLYTWGDSLGYRSLGQRISIFLQGMILLVALLLMPLIITNSLKVWAKDRVVRESLNPVEKKKVKKPVTQSDFIIIKKFLSSRFGFFWRRKIRKCLILGSSIDTEQLLPNLTTEHWQLSDRTLMLYGGDVLDEPKVQWLKNLKKHLGRVIILRRKPLDAIIWLLPNNYLTLNRLQQAKLEKIVLLMQDRCKTLGWRAPIYLVSTKTNSWQQIGREEQSIGTLFTKLTINNLDSVDPLIANLAEQCCKKGMYQVLNNNKYAFLLKLSQDLISHDNILIKQWLEKWLSSPKAISPRGLLFTSLPTNPVDSDELLYLPEHNLTMTPTWQTISDDAAKQSGSRIGINWGRGLHSLILISTGLMCVGLFTSFYQNRSMIINDRALVKKMYDSQSAPYGEQLQIQYNLQLQLDQLLYRQQNSPPLSYQFGLNKNNALLNTLLPYYITINNRNIGQPFFDWQTDYLTRLTAMSPTDPMRAKFVDSGYEVLKAYLMLSIPNKIDPAYLGDFASRFWTAPNNIGVGEWRKLMPELVSFWGKVIQYQPELAMQRFRPLVKDVRQILINQIGVQNAEGTVYQSILNRASQNYGNLTLAMLLSDFDSRMLFSSTAPLPSVFTRKAWEKVIKNEIADAAKVRQEQIDWVLSDNDNGDEMASISPEVLRQNLTDRYFSDYSAAWLNFLNNIQWRPADNIADVIEQLTLMSDTRQSPVIALMNVIKYQAQIEYSGDGISDHLIQSTQNLVKDNEPTNLNNKIEASGPLTPTFGMLLNLINNENNNNDLSLQTYLLKVTQVRLKLQNITSSRNPQAAAKQLARSVFQGTSVDLTNTRDYGNLIAANLGDEWAGFGYTIFKQPLEQSWQVILTPAANSFNDTWQQQIAYEWENAFAGRYPFKNSDNDASLSELARFLRPEAGVIDRFITNELNGLFEKQGDNWVINSANAQGLNFSPQFINAINLFNALSHQVISNGDTQVSFDLMPRSGGNIMRSELIVGKQKLEYFNQMPVWQRFKWPSEGYAPYAQLSWSEDDSGMRLYAYHSGDWALIRLLEAASVKQLDSSRYELVWQVPNIGALKYILRSQSGEGPLTLLKLRNFVFPKQVFDTSKTYDSVKVSL